MSGLSGLTTLMQVRKSDIEQIQCNVFQVHVLSSVENRVSKGHHVHMLRNFRNSMHCVLMHDISITMHRISKITQHVNMVALAYPIFNT